MKTIKKGWTASPVGLTLRCYRCDGQFEVESEDEVGIGTEEGANFYIAERCPTPKCFGVPKVAVPERP